jgi:hypothetical protein
MFSHDRIDAGSELLASRLPNDFKGDVADFGAGWGYLSVELAEPPRPASRASTSTRPTMRWRPPGQHGPERPNLPRASSGTI